MKPTTRKPPTAGRFISLVERQKDGSALALMATASPDVVERVTAILLDHARAIGDLPPEHVEAK